MIDPTALPTIDEAYWEEFEPEPASHDDGDEGHEAAPVEPGEVIEP